MDESVTIAQDYDTLKKREEGQSAAAAAGGAGSVPGIDSGEDEELDDDEELEAAIEIDDGLTEEQREEMRLADLQMEAARMGAGAATTRLKLNAKAGPLSLH